MGEGVVRPPPMCFFPLLKTFLLRMRMKNNELKKKVLLPPALLGQKVKQQLSYLPFIKIIFIQTLAEIIFFFYYFCDPLGSTLKHMK